MDSHLRVDAQSSPPGADNSIQPGKGPVTMFVTAATIVACLGFVGHLAGLL